MNKERLATALARQYTALRLVLRFGLQLAVVKTLADALDAVDAAAAIAKCNNAIARCKK